MKGKKALYWILGLAAAGTAGVIVYKKVFQKKIVDSSTDLGRKDDALKSKILSSDSKAKQ